MDTQQDPTTAKIADIAPPDHERVNWGDMHSLSSSIKTFGVLVPTAVQPNPDPNDTRPWKRIAGSRRTRAAIMAGLDEVPIVVKRGLTEAQVAEEQAAENLDREGLHPMDRAAYYERMAVYGSSVADIAARFRQTPRDVKRSLRLLALTPDLRRAFASEAFDERAALAISRLSTEQEQHDVLTAIEQGALQPEEVEGFVERSFSNPLAEAEWRLDDRALLPVVGACTACPKRSGAQPDLFDDRGNDRCLDVGCWGRKMDAAYESVASLSKVEGAHVAVIDDSPDKIFMPSAKRPIVLRGSGYVDADASCPHLPGRTWQEAIEAVTKPGADPPTRYLTRDSGARPRLLYREAVVARLVRKSDAAAAAQENKTSADPEGRTAARARRSLVDRIAAVVVEKNPDAWEWAVARVLDLVSRKARTFAAAQMKVTPEALEQAITSNRTAKLTLLSALVCEVADATDGAAMPQAIHDLLALCETSVDEVKAKAGIA